MKFCHLTLASLLLAAALFAGAASGDDPSRAEAREHFSQAVTMFDQRRFADALAEFDKSYALYPAYMTLYNIGLVNVALGHPVEAAGAFEKFLAQGGESIPAAKRAQVESELKEQQQRVGEIKAAVKPDGAEIRVDGNVVGKAPLSSPVKVAQGPHRVEVMLDGYHTERRDVEVKGLGLIEVPVQLTELTLGGLVAHRGAEVPLLAPPAPAPMLTCPAPPANPLAAPESPKAKTQRIVAYSIGGLGLAGMAAGAGIAIAGQSKHDDALMQWASGDHKGAQQTENNSVSQKNTGYVTMGAGAGVLLAGVIVLLTVPSGSPTHSHLDFTPWFMASSAGASLKGVW